MGLYKLALLGDGGVGKSALTIRMATDRFVEEYDPTIENTYRKQVIVDDEACTLEVLDTAGREEHSSMREMYINGAQGILCVYSVTSRSSFEEIDTFRQQVLRVKEQESVPMMIVGNKCDLDSAREVLKSEGQSYADRHGLPFFETSAKEGINVEQPFHSLVRQIQKLPCTSDAPAKVDTRRKKTCLLL